MSINTPNDSFPENDAEFLQTNYPETCRTLQEIEDTGIHEDCRAEFDKFKIEIVEILKKEPHAIEVVNINIGKLKIQLEHAREHF